MKLGGQILLGGLLLLVAVGLIEHYGVIYRTFSEPDYSGYTRGELIGMIADCRQIPFNVAERMYEGSSKESLGKTLEFCRKTR